jgi:hypothetical protein
VFFCLTGNNIFELASFWLACTSFKTKGLFGSVVAIAFQIVFRAKMHVNDVFLFFKNYF